MNPVSSLVSIAISLSAEFFTNKDYAGFYERFGERMSGFPGIYQYVEDLAEVFQEMESQNNGVSLYINDGIDYFILIEDFVTSILQISITKDFLPTVGEAANIFTDCVNNQKGKLNG